MKSFCALNGIIERPKRQHAKWQNVSANHIYVKRLLSKIHKELLKPSKKISNPSKSGQRICTNRSPKKIHIGP